MSGKLVACILEQQTMTEEALGASLINFFWKEVLIDLITCTTIPG